MNKREKLNYSKKNIILVLTSVICLLFIYKKVISKTLVLANEINFSETTLLNLSQIPTEIKSINNQLSIIDKNIGNLNLSPEELQQTLLDKFSVSCLKNNSEINYFSEPHETKQNNYRLITSEVSIKGDFVSILKTIYDAELNFEQAKIVSVNFFLKLNIKTKNKELYAKIYFQYIKRV
jgi:hypothetical protein